MHREPDAARRPWTLIALASSSRSATVAASTAIEGNPLTVAQVQDILTGGTSEADPIAVREVRNYNTAMDIATAAAHRPNFRWTDELMHRVNREVMRGLPDDTLGEYREGAVRVAGLYDPPGAPLVDALMSRLVEWLAGSSDHPLVRSALLHLNFVAIHPFDNGNGRSARVLASLELMRSGFHAPELVSVESYLQRHRVEYFDILATTLGPTYDPENHAATPWIDWYVGVSERRLNDRTTILDAALMDIGQLVDQVQRRGEPIDWVPLLLAARMQPVRSADVAGLLGISGSRARTLLAGMARVGWIVSQGQTRGRRYVAGEQLLALPLRTPELMQPSLPGMGVSATTASLTTSGGGRPRVVLSPDSRGFTAASQAARESAETG